MHEGFQFGGPSGGASDRRAFLAMVRADCGSAPDLRVAIEDFQYMDLGGGCSLLRYVERQRGAGGGGAAIRTASVVRDGLWLQMHQSSTARATRDIGVDTTK